MMPASAPRQVQHLGRKWRPCVRGSGGSKFGGTSAVKVFRWRMNSTMSARDASAPRSSSLQGSPAMVKAQMEQVAINPIESAHTCTYTRAHTRTQWTIVVCTCSDAYFLFPVRRAWEDQRAALQNTLGARLVRIVANGAGDCHTEKELCITTLVSGTRAAGAMAIRAGRVRGRVKPRCHHLPPLKR